MLLCLPQPIPKKLESRASEVKDDERETFLDIKAEHTTEESDLEYPETAIVLHKHHSYRTAIPAIFTFNEKTYLHNRDQCIPVRT